MCRPYGAGELEPESATKKAGCGQPGEREPESGPRSSSSHRSISEVFTVQNSIDGSFFQAASMVSILPAQLKPTITGLLLWHLSPETLARGMPSIVYLAVEDDMAESIGELVALAVGLVVFFYLKQSFSNGEVGQDRGRQLRHGHPVTSSGVSRQSGR